MNRPPQTPHQNAHMRHDGLQQRQDTRQPRATHAVTARVSPRASTQAVQPRQAGGQPAHAAQPPRPPVHHTAQLPPEIYIPQATVLQAKKKKSAAEVQSKAQRSFNNICAYRAGWVRKNDISLATVTAFIRTYPSGIRGHASGDNSQGEQGNTTADCLAYRSWHRGIYGWR